MRQIERFELIDRIGRELQSRMTYTDIDVYLGGFDVPPLKGGRSSNSKWVYTKERLAVAADAVVIQIADELQIPHSHVIRPGRKVEESRFWQPGHLRLFLSHLSSFKKKTSALQKSLRLYGVSSFVAHVDIRPTRTWEREIENALFSMHALVAILMPGFKKSDWTDQEVGVAVGRGVPIIPIMKGLNPYGFIGKYQGFDATGKSVGEVAHAVFDILLTHDQTASKMWTALMDTLALSATAEEAAAKLEVLETLDEIPTPHLERLRDGVAEGGGLLGESDTLRQRLNEVLEAGGVEKIGASRIRTADDVADDLPF